MQLRRDDGFVERVVGACDRIESALDPGVNAPSVATALATRLFESVLGYEAADYEQTGGVARFRETDDDSAIVLVAAGHGANAPAVVDPAFAAAAGTPDVGYVVAATPTRLLVFECVDDAASEDFDGDDVRTLRGVTARQHADVSIAEVVAAGRHGPLSQTLDPAEQLGVGKLGVLRASKADDDSGDIGTVGDGGDDETDGDDSTAATDSDSTATAVEDPATDAATGQTASATTDATGQTASATTDATGQTASATTAADGRYSPTSEAGFETLVGTLRDCLHEVLLPAVETAFADVHPRIEMTERERESLAAAFDTASAAADETSDTVTGPARDALLDHRREFADASALQASYGTWVRGARRTGFTPSENRRAFQRVTAFTLLDELLVTHVVESHNLTPSILSGSAGDTLERAWETCGLDRDAGDRFDAAREARQDTVERRAPETFAWATGHDAVSEAVASVGDYLDQFALDVAPERIAAVYDRLLSAVELPGLAVDHDDSTPEVVLDRVWTDGDGARGAAAALLDPACGDGRFLVAASERLRGRLADASPTARLRAVRGSITGVDPDPLACRVTETRLLFGLLPDLLAVRATDDEFTLSPLRVFRTDPLAGERDGRPPAPDALTGRSYDAVVGRFPTVLRRDVPDGPAADAYADYETAYYTYDLSALYVERARNWLTPGGTLAAVVAGRFRDTRFGQKLRERLPGWYDIAELRELPGEAPGGSPLLVAGTRRESSETPADERRPAGGTVTVADEIDAEGRAVPVTRLTGEEWAFETASGEDVVESEPTAD
jgi:hypothetical protein